MRYFQKFSTKLAILLLGISAWNGTANAMGNLADSAVVAIDGSGTISTIWRAIDPITGDNKIQGVHGSASGPWTITTLTRTSGTGEESASNPVIAASSLSTATTKAVAVWVAIDDSSGNTIIQAGTCSASGWSTTITTLSLNNGTEVPQNTDQKVAISQDGTTIIATWSAYMTGSQDTVVRTNFSTNGGSSWSTPANMSIL